MFIIIWMLLKCVVVEILTYHASWNMTKLQFSLIIYVITWSPSGTRTLSDSVTSVQVPRDSNYSRTIVEGNKHRESWSFLLWITSHNHSYSTAGAHMQTYIHTYVHTQWIINPTTLFVLFISSCTHSLQKLHDQLSPLVKCQAKTWIWYARVHTHTQTDRREKTLATSYTDAEVLDRGVLLTNEGIKVWNIKALVSCSTELLLMSSSCVLI